MVKRALVRACANARRLVEEVTYGVIAMDTYVFEPAGQSVSRGEAVPA